MTNLILAPEDMSAATWTANLVAITDDNAVAPDGTTTADLLIPSAASTTSHQVGHDNLVGLNAAPHTVAAFVKPGGYDKIALAFAGTLFADEVSVLFDITAKAVLDIDDGTSVVVDSTVIEQYPDGWLRLHVTATTLASGNGFTRIYPANVSTLVDGIGTTAFAGDTVSGVHVWGVTFNEGATADDYTAESGQLISLGTRNIIAVTRRTAEQMRPKQRMQKPGPGLFR